MLNTLPEHILLRGIARRLTKRDAASLASTCRRLRALHAALHAAAAPCLYRTIVSDRLLFGGAMSPDGRLVVASGSWEGGGSGAGPRVWDAVTGELLPVELQGTARLRGLAFHFAFAPDSAHVAAAVAKSSPRVGRGHRPGGAAPQVPEDRLPGGL